MGEVHEKKVIRKPVSRGGQQSGSRATNIKNCLWGFSQWSISGLFCQKSEINQGGSFTGSQSNLGGSFRKNGASWLRKSVGAFTNTTSLYRKEMGQGRGEKN